MIFADAAATTPVRREVLEAMWPYLAGGEGGDFGNPSSVHEIGTRAARALADARRVIADRLGCRPGEVIVTSGGTEADNLAVKGIALATPRGRHVIVSAIEHEAVLASADYLRRLHGFEVTTLPVGADGRVDPGELDAALRDDTTLVSIQHANNEVGTVQPIRELAAIARSRGVPFHTDAVQTVGALPVRRDDLGVDALTISGHKLGAPKGVGALIVRGAPPLEPLVHGGGQERGRRSGTENVAGVVGLAAALAASGDGGGDGDGDDSESRGFDADGGAADAVTDSGASATDSAVTDSRTIRTTAARDLLLDGIRALVPGALVTGSLTRRLPNHASFCFPGSSGEAILLELERAGVVSSSGSACAAGRDEPSHVLLALGLDAEVARTAVRFTLADDVTLEQARAIARSAVKAVESVSALG